jgi:hypothetical protein
VEIPVLIEPSAGGFRASTQVPVPLSAEAGTEAAAIDALTAAMRGRLSGSKLRSVTLTEPELVLDLAERIRTNPVHEEMLKSIEEYRKNANAVEDTD